MIKGFKTFNEESELDIAVNNMIEYQQFIGMDFESLDEIKLVDIKKQIAEAGLQVKKGRGFIEIIESSGIHFTKAIHTAIIASSGNLESKETLKELLSKKIKKENIVDFLLKLDHTSFQAISEAIQMIESLTEWEIISDTNKVRNPSNNLKNKDIVSKFKDITSKLKV